MQSASVPYKLNILLLRRRRKCAVNLQLLFDILKITWKNQMIASVWNTKKTQTAVMLYIHSKLTDSSNK